MGKVLKLTVPLRVWMCILAIFMVFGATFMAGTTHSWFFYAGQSDVGILAGKVNYVGSGTFIPDTKEDDNSSYIYPGRQLIATKSGLENWDYPTVTNHSSIETNVRVQIKARVMDAGEPIESGVPLICASTENDSMWQLGTMTADETPKMIPLVNVTFTKNTTEVTGYSWKKIEDEKVSPDVIEWELVPTNQTISASVIGIPKDKVVGDTYRVMDSLVVVPALSLEDEITFTNIYASKKLSLTITYLAKQNAALDWQVFYESNLII